MIQVLSSCRAAKQVVYNQVVALVHGTNGVNKAKKLQMESYAQQFSRSQSQAVKFGYMTFFSTHMDHINAFHCMIPIVTLCRPSSLVGRMI